MTAIIEAREYALYLLRICLVQKRNITEPPNIYEWDYKMRHVNLTYKDCQTINSTNLYMCSDDLKANDYAQKFLSTLNDVCKGINQPAHEWTWSFYILLMFLLGTLLLHGFHLNLYFNSSKKQINSAKIVKDIPDHLVRTQCDCSEHHHI